jgi:hypothetical protein
MKIWKRIKEFFGCREPFIEVSQKTFNPEFDDMNRLKSENKVCLKIGLREKLPPPGSPDRD